MGTLLSTVIRAKSGMRMHSFEQATKQPRAAQTKLLRTILGRNRETEYGQEHAFSQITGAGMFAGTIPVNTYSDFLPYVERMKNGERKILTADQPHMFNLTSGTTDRPKFVPITSRGMALTAGVSDLWLARALRDHPSFLDDSTFCISSAPVEGKTPSGIPYGSASGMIYKNLPRVLHKSFVLPFVLSEIEDYVLRYYVMARLAMEKEISFIVTPNPTTLIKIAETGIRYQEEIVRSVHDGNICCNRFRTISRKDERILESIILKPNHQRARILQQVIDQHGALMPSACWTQLKLISCWLGGSIGFQADKLSRYFSDDVPKRDLGYLSSEASVTIPYQDNTPAGILAIQNNYYEFIPDGENVVPGDRALGCHEIEQGKRYKILLTNWNGLYRYDIHDIIEVHGFYNRTPVIAFVRKSDDMLNITGEKLHVNHFLKAFRDMKDAYNLPVIQFRAIPNYEQLRYEILMHVGPELSREFLRTTLVPFIDRSLSRTNIEYAGKRISQRLNPPCIHIMDSSWEEDVRLHSVKAGCRDIQHKWRMLTTEMCDLDAKHIQYSVQL